MSNVYALHVGSVRFAQATLIAGSATTAMAREGAVRIPGRTRQRRGADKKAHMLAVVAQHYGNVQIDDLG